MKGWQKNLDAYLLGDLDEAACAALEAVLESNPDAKAELDARLELEHLMALSIEPVSPAPGGRARLMAELEDPVERLTPFLDRFAALVNLTTAQARARLALVFDPSAWVDVGIPDALLVHFEGGPATVGADVGFVRLEAGADFPWHTHQGNESTLVLQGGYTDSEGFTVRAGDLVQGDAGDRHMFTALEGEDLIYAVVVFGVEFDIPVDLH